MGVTDTDATNPWGLTYFSSSDGLKWTNQILGKYGGTNRNRCTQTLVVLHAMTH